MAEPIPFKPRRPCPICKKPSQPKFHPFCSSRCAQVDLNRWLSEGYAIPSDEIIVSGSEGEERPADED